MNGVWLFLYRSALRLYPRRFREAYADLMRDDARDLLDEAGGDRRTRARSVRRLFLDLFRSLPREWLRALSPGAARRADTRPAVASGLRSDAAAAARSLSRHPRFALGVVALLGVGIAACTIVASVVSAYTLRPLPYPEPDRLVAVSPAVPVETGDVEDLFELAASWDLDVFTLLDADAPELVYGRWISPDYAELFGVRVESGRLFTGEEYAPGGPAVALISRGLWLRRYGGDPEVIGQRLSAFTSDRPDDAETFTIVGVVSEESWALRGYADFLTPLRADRTVYVGRLREGVPPGPAARALEDRAGPRPAWIPEDAEVELVSLQEQYTASLRPVLGVGLATVALVLLIACGNTAALLLVRAAGREREFTVRRALGAARGRIGRQLLLEGGFLSGVAALLGLGLAVLGLGAFRGALEAQLGIAVPGGVESLTVDGRALAVTLVIAAATGIVFGLVPLAGLLRTSEPGLREEARGSTIGGRSGRIQSAIVAGGVALSLTLMVPAALAVGSARNVANLELGFEPTDIYRSGMLLRRASYPEVEDRAAFFERVAERVRAVPGVTSVGMGPVPMDDGAPRVVEPEPGPDARGLRVETRVYVHDAGWLETISTPLLAGRGFLPGDTPAAEGVALVSRELGARLWPGDDPVGKRLRVTDMPGAGGDPSDRPWLRVVGVVPGIRGGVSDSTRFAIHRPLGQAAGVWTNVLVRGQPGLGSPLEEIREAVGELDPTVATAETGWLTTAIDDARRPARFLATLLAGFALVALALAVLGLYAVLSFAAARRTREVAIRMAIGARGGQVARAFLYRGLALVAAGLLVGVVGAVLLGRGVETQLHGVELGVPVFALCAAALVLVGAAAAWIPARRASRHDPMRILRAE